MRIGLLLCEHVDSTLIEVAGGDYDILYRDFLQRADPTLEVVPYDVINGVFPQDPDECDAWVITGSRHDAFADTPWIEELREFVRRIDERQARVAGICFGHQVIAEALGGRVERAGEWKVGPQVLNMTPQPWFEGGELIISGMHRDVVTELPPGAAVIAEGTTAAIPAFRVGDHILGIQDHPEYERPFMEALVDHRDSAVLLHEVAEDARRRLREMPTEGATVGRWVVNFLQDRRIDPIIVESVLRGPATEVRVGDRTVETGFVKSAVTEAEVGPLGLVGDVVADAGRHGGVDQAIYVYLRQDYDWWERRLGKPLPAGSFGENLTISRAGANPVRVGDLLTIGEVVLEVTGPRNPCSVFATILGESEWSRRFRDARRPGYYCRVLAGGKILTGSEVTWTAAPDSNVTVVEMVDAKLDPSAPRELIERILDSPVAERARESFEHRLECAVPGG